MTSQSLTSQSVRMLNHLEEYITLTFFYARGVVVKADAVVISDIQYIVLTMKWKDKRLLYSVICHSLFTLSAVSLHLSLFIADIEMADDVC